MTFKSYLDILVKRWWIVLVAFAVVFTSTYIWTAGQEQVYVSRATFVIRPRSEMVLGNDYIRALDTISNRGEINTTFAEVASSKVIENRAMEAMGVTPQDRKGLSVSARVIGGANILEISVESYSPTLSHDFADAVGAETTEYINGLYDIYQIEPLDSANTPAKPIKPDITLNLTLGAVLGLALGVGLAFLFESFKPTFREVDTFNIIDRETGAYNKSYLSHRLLQEMVRTRRTKSPLSFGLVKVNFNGDNLSEPEQTEALRTVKILTEKTLREEDILARFNGVTFAILFPDLSLESARQSLENVRQVIGSVAHDLPSKNGHSPLHSYSSVVSYTGSAQMNQDHLVEKALEALQNVSSQ